MKKILAFILATILCLSISIPAFAFDYGDEKPETTIAEEIETTTEESTTEELEESWNFDYSLAEGEGHMTVNKADSGIEAVVSNIPRQSIVGNFTPTYVEISVNQGRKLKSVTVEGIEYSIGFRDCFGTTSLNSNSVKLSFGRDLAYEKWIPVIKATTDAHESTTFTVTVTEENERGSVTLFSGTGNVDIEVTTKEVTTRKPITTVPAPTQPTQPATPNRGGSSSRPNLSSKNENTTLAPSYTRLATPMISSVSKLEDGGIEVAWGEVSGATNYRVLYKADGETEWKTAGDTNNTSFIWVDGKEDTNYAFTVVCLADDGYTYLSDYDTIGRSAPVDTADDNAFRLPEEESNQPETEGTEQPEEKPAKNNFIWAVVLAVIVVAIIVLVVVLISKNRKNGDEGDDNNGMAQDNPWYPTQNEYVEQNTMDSIPNNGE